MTTMENKKALHFSTSTSESSVVGLQSGILTAFFYQLGFFRCKRKDSMKHRRIILTDLVSFCLITLLPSTTDLAPLEWVPLPLLFFSSVLTEDFRVFLEIFGLL
jgi:hypothetical protein